MTRRATPDAAAPAVAALPPLPPREEWIIRVRRAPGRRWANIPTEVSIRLFLKVALRAFGLRATYANAVRPALARWWWEHAATTRTMFRLWAKQEVRRDARERRCNDRKPSRSYTLARREAERRVAA